jgi:hypothetical protein
MPCQAQCTVYVESTLAPCSLFTSNQPLHLVHSLRRINPCTLFSSPSASYLIFSYEPHSFLQASLGSLGIHSGFRLRTDHCTLSVKLNTHLQLVSRSRISGSMHPFPHKPVGQWFSTFVRPRLSKFFFYKTGLGPNKFTHK